MSKILGTADLSGSLIHCHGYCVLSFHGEKFQKDYFVVCAVLIYFYPLIHSTCTEHIYYFGTGCILAYADMWEGENVPFRDTHWLFIWFSFQYHFTFLQRTVGNCCSMCWASHIFLASVMKAVLFSLFAPPGVHKQTSLLEWHNGFGHWVS